MLILICLSNFKFYTDKQKLLRSAISVLGLTIAPKEIENIAYAKFKTDNIEYYGFLKKAYWDESPPKSTLTHRSQLRRLNFANSCF